MTTNNRRHEKLKFLIYLAASALIVVGVFLFLNRPQLVRVDAKLPVDFPTSGFSHSPFEVLLHRYVDAAGNVDYEEWHSSTSDRHALDSYLAGVVAFSPENAADRFPTRADRLAYWLYAYNAYVIRSVLDHWPLDSVTDVKAPIEAVTGLGFFYRQRFLFGGSSYSLYAVEHEKVLADFRDPRVHFVLNCASESCPILRPELPVGDELEVMLADATVEFINDSRNVRVDAAQERIVLSSIFKMYRSDFVNDLRRRGLSSEAGVLSYIAQYAAESLRADLASASEFEVEFADYDWTLNADSTQDP